MTTQPHRDEFEEAEKICDKIIDRGVYWDELGYAKEILQKKEVIAAIANASREGEKRGYERAIEDAYTALGEGNVPKQRNLRTWAMARETVLNELRARSVLDAKGEGEV